MRGGGGDMLGRRRCGSGLTGGRREVGLFLYVGLNEQGNGAADWLVRSLCTTRCNTRVVLPVRGFDGSRGRTRGKVIRSRGFSHHVRLSTRELGNIFAVCGTYQKIKRSRWVREYEGKVVTNRHRKHRCYCEPLRKIPTKILL